MSKNRIPLVHDREAIAAEAVTEFADAAVDDQRRALAELRRRASVDQAGWVLGMGAVLIAFGSLFAPAPDLTATDWLSRFISGGLLGVLIGVMALPLVVYTAWARDRAGAARAWLGAYEDELARRHRDRSWAGRAWRKSH